jgi:hypothetical protein
MAIDESEREELLRRRLVETVANEIRPRLFGTYVVIGTVVASLLGYVGYNIISGLEGTAKQYVERAIEDEIDPKIAEADLQFKEVDATQRQVQRLLDKSQSQIEASDQLIEDLRRRLAGMVEERDKAARELEAAKALRAETHADLAASREQLARLNDDVTSSLEQLNTLKDELQNLRAGSQEYDSLTNAFTAISDVQKSVGLIDGRLRAIEAGAAQGETHTVAATPQFTEAEKQEIEAAIHVHQAALAVSPASPAAADAIKGGMAVPGRTIVEIEYTVTVDDTETTRRHGGNQLIERVIYTLDKNWFSNPEIISINRVDNFKMSVRVWGRTKVGVTIVVNGLKDPIERARSMSLSDPVVF